MNQELLSPPHWHSTAALSARRGRLIEPLTRRELQVLGLICEGHSNQEISEQVGIIPATVKYHVHNIFAKLGVRRRTQAVAVGVYLRLVQPAWLLTGDGGSKKP